jgi:acetyltransferase-like isoleucine patch superfamily enzyme
MKGRLIHPTALIETSEIGANTRVWAYVHIMSGARIGDNCNIGDYCFIESGTCIGNNTVVKNGTMIWEGVTLENEVFVGPQVFFTNDLYPRSRYLPRARSRYKSKEGWLVPTRVKRGASLGAGAIILAGVTVGEYSMVGAGAVVTKNVPAYALVKGNPARVAGWLCRCGHRLTFSDGAGACSRCYLEFRKDKNSVKAVRKRKQLERTMP